MRQDLRAEHQVFTLRSALGTLCSLKQVSNFSMLVLLAVILG